MSTVSVVVVSYNTKALLRKCLAAIEPEHEVIVIDNASSDGSADMVRSEFPAAILVENKINVGFGGANNQGIALATRPLVLLLNSDAYAEPGAIGLLSEVFQDPRIVAAGGKLLNLDGSFQKSASNSLRLWVVFCEQLYLERLFSPYWKPDLATNTKVTQVMGACLMMRPVEKFDERYFLYCEDTDLCKRLSEHGKILYVPSARFTHELGSSSSGASRWLSVARYNRGKELYFSTHHGSFASLVCLFMNRLGAMLRLMAWAIVTLFTLGKRGGDKVALFTNVLIAPVSGPPDPREFRKA